MATELQDLRFSMTPHNFSMAGMREGRFMVCRMTLSGVVFYDGTTALSWAQKGSASMGCSGPPRQENRSLPA